MTGRGSRRRVADNQSGFALLTVVLLLMAVTAILAPFVLAARTQVAIASNAARREVLDLAAEGLLVTLARQLAAPPAEKRNSALSVRSHPLRCVEAGLRIEARIQDQRGLVDLNLAPEPLLELGFAAAGVPAGRAASLARGVLAYRASPREGELDDPGLEKLFHDGLKDGPFEALEELYDLRDLRNVPLQRLARAFTIHGRRDTIVGILTPPALARLVPRSANGQFPFVTEADSAPPTYRLEVEVRSAEDGPSGYAGAILLATRNDRGDFDLIERTSDPGIMPETRPPFGSAGSCDILFGEGVVGRLGALRG